MKRKVEIAAAAALGVTLLLAFLWSQRAHPPSSLSAPDAAPRALAGVVAERHTIPVLVESVGTVRSRRQTEVASRILAEVHTVEVRTGDAVDAGDLLVTLDDRDHVSQREQARAHLAAAEQALGEAQTEFQRTENLVRKEARTQQDLDLATYQLHRATAERDAAQKALEGAEVQLGFARVKAPFDGVIYARHVDPGDLATPGRALLGLYDPEQLRIEVRVEEGLLRRVHLGAELSVRLDALDRELPGKVSEVVPAVDAATRTGTIKLDLPQDPALSPGMFGRLRLPTAEREAVLVPPGAVLQRGQLELVFAVQEGADGVTRARLTLVRAGGLHALEGHAVPWLEILAGLEAGTRVVRDVPADLEDGAVLRGASVGATSEDGERRP